ncbi:MAG TPA: response regulator [Bryobacteraceae bacterium]|nr:response regulator [Bryobacterales bacterium]HRJ19207.1 response regulator [Bryobacteraceae bacterium]
MEQTHKPKALIVDDSRAVRMILARNLRELGYETGEAGDGVEALRLLTADPGGFSLALVDWNMPEMNGMELLRAVRADARLAALTVLMVTTETEIEHMAAALDAGANEYVMKPFTREILFDKLQLAGLGPLGQS